MNHFQEQPRFQTESPTKTLKPKLEQEFKVKPNHTVRVDVERLENLMNLVGELVIDQTRIVEIKKFINKK
ncbi:hypothetical protein KHA80_23135 [Anaerobacillus sp. HL2]|nr:hypothetical protein KHA80_23135 [Anaerobacillus sp. HL2]